MFAPTLRSRNGCHIKQYIWWEEDGHVDEHGDSRSWDWGRRLQLFGDHHPTHPHAQCGPILPPTNIATVVVPSSMAYRSFGGFLLYSLMAFYPAGGMILARSGRMRWRYMFLNVFSQSNDSSAEPFCRLVPW